MTLEELRALYRKHFNDLDLSAPRFTVRQWDGMDGCWSDLDEAKDVDEATALAVWAERTRNGTEKTSYQDIDYYRIFPANTRMHFDENNELFR